jgi:Fe-S-cluster containining protein
MNIRESSSALLKVYAEMSAAFGAFQGASGLHCPPGCGRCCLNPEIEATVFEMLPFALMAHDEGKLEDWLAKLAATDQDVCVIFTGQNCGKYEGRPSVCRMFAVAGYFNKDRQKDLSICKVLKENDPSRAQEFRKSMSGDQVPMLSEWAARVQALSPQQYAQRLPINQAIKVALELVALNAQYQAL